MIITLPTFSVMANVGDRLHRRCCWRWRIYYVRSSDVGFHWPVLVSRDVRKCWPVYQCCDRNCLDCMSELFAYDFGSVEGQQLQEVM